MLITAEIMTNPDIQIRYKALRAPGSSSRYLRDAACLGAAAALELARDVAVGGVVPGTLVPVRTTSHQDFAGGCADVPAP